MTVHDRYHWGHDEIGLLGSCRDKARAIYEAINFLGINHGVKDPRGGLWIYDNMARHRSINTWKLDDSRGGWGPVSSKL